MQPRFCYTTFARAFVALVFLFSVSTSLNANLFNQGLAAVDRELPEFSLLDVDGAAITPAALKGKTWLINFWAVWCAPCLDELPALNNMWTQLEEQDVGMLAINIGGKADDIEAFLIQHNLSIDFPIVLGDATKTLGNWGGRSLPYTVVVSPHGKVVYEAVGPREWDKAEFVDAVVAVNDLAPPTLMERAKASLSSFQSSFQGSPTWVKIAAALVVPVIALLVIFSFVRGRRRTQASS